MAPSNSDAIEGAAAAFQRAPGTEILYDQGNHVAADLNLHECQHHRRGVLLVPQPSLTDPNDPLRWSLVKKWTVFSTGLAYSFLGAVTGPIMAACKPSKPPATILESLPISKGWFKALSFSESHFKSSLMRMVQLFCARVWQQCFGCEEYARSSNMKLTTSRPFAIKYGRRPVYLLSTLLMGVACIWLGVASTRTYTPFLVGRAFLGIWEAPIESIVPSTITDIFFLHDRGAKVSIYGLSVLGGNELGPTLSAFIIQYLGMDWAFYIVTMFIGLTLTSMIFFMPESKYTGPRPVMPWASSPTATTSIRDKAAVSHHEALEIGLAQEDSPPKRTWLQEITSLPQADPSVNIFHTFVRPFALLAYPTVLWSCLIYGLALSWNVVLGATTAQLFAPPPYLFDSQAQGLVFLSPLIGSLVGTYLCGPLADSVANFITRRSGGIREPEMRLPVCIIAVLLTFIGALISGLSLHYQLSWSAPVIGFGVLSTGAQMGATLSMSYALDCHKELSVELMVTIASMKSLIAWIWTWVINDWVAKDGPLVVFMTIAAVNAGIYLLTIILYMRGKEIRIWISRQNLFERLGVQ